MVRGRATGMHVVTKARLVAFWKIHPAAEAPLKIWLAVVTKRRYSDPAALKALAAEHGFGADAAEAAWNDPSWKARLKRANDEAIAALKNAGFKGELKNLKGGITAWSNEVDPKVPKY